MLPVVKQVFVNIYVHILGGCFPTTMANRLATGSEIYRFLVNDAGLCWDYDKCTFLPGDCILWYLGACEHHGCLIYQDRIWRWNQGEASFETVEAYVRALYQDGLFTEDQYQSMLIKIDQGRHFVRVHDIHWHLVAQGRERSSHVIRINPLQRGGHGAQVQESAQRR